MILIDDQKKFINIFFFFVDITPVVSKLKLFPSNNTEEHL